MAAPFTSPQPAGPQAPTPQRITTFAQLAQTIGRSTFAQPTSATSGLAGYDLEGSKKRPPHPGAKPIR